MHGHLSRHSAAVLIVTLAATIAAQTSSCTNILSAKYAAPSVSPGFEVKVVANGLENPRGILFDTSGNLLVVQQGKGIAALKFNDQGGSCIGKAEYKDVILDGNLNHGIELSSDGGTLYASSSMSVFSWSYEATSRSNTSAPRTLITGMGNSGHSTRTLLLSNKVNGTLLVSWGSQSNIDSQAKDITTGVSQIKAFNILNISEPYNYPTSGLRLGWGLRNDVGMAEEPITGGIYSVENSVDQMSRAGKDIHQNNPGEELNFLGYLNGSTSSDLGKNFGYPSCFAAWDVDSIPNNQGLKVGDQFAIDDENSSAANDTYCRDQTVAPKLTFQAHTAPLDIKFNSKATTAWITFHGSWNRDEPTGYKVSSVQFASGFPVEPADSKSALTDIVTNQDLSRCPEQCFRPVGLAWDNKGRLFFSSDATGEIYVITTTTDTDQTSTDGTSPSSTGSATSSPSTPSLANPIYFSKATICFLVALFNSLAIVL